MYPRSIVKLAAYKSRRVVLRVPHIIMKMWTSNVHIYDRVSTTNNNLTQIMYVYLYIYPDL